MIESVGVKVAVAAGRQNFLRAIAVEVGHHRRGVGGNGVIPVAVRLDQGDVGNQSRGRVAPLFESFKNGPGTASPLNLQHRVSFFPSSATQHNPTSNAYRY